MNTLVHSRFLGLARGTAVLLLLVLLGMSPGAPAKASPLLTFTSQGHVLGFDTDGFYLSNGRYVFQTTFLGAQAVAPQSDIPATSGEPPVLSQVSYPNLWPGISLRYDQGGGVIRSSYTVAVGANPAAIRLRYNVPAQVNSDGSLSLAFETGSLTESPPIAWQEVDGQRVPVQVAFQLYNSTEVGFKVGVYNPHIPLFIDPTLTWNTFLGGTGTDTGYSIAVDGSGNVYVAGRSTATWGSPVRPYTAGFDAFAARLDAATGSLTWNTFLGGAGNDEGRGIAVDGSGNVYVVGYSGATWGSPVRPFGGGTDDAFAARLDAATGSLTWNTFLGGTGNDYGYGIAVDGSSNVYVTGRSSATWGSPVRPYGGGTNDAFAARLDAATGSLTWHTFLGGTGADYGFGIAVDGSGNVYVAGRSGATWGSPVRPFGGGTDDALVARLDAATGSLTWHTFLGGAGTDIGQGIAVDGSGNVYVAAYSSTTWGSPVRPYTAGDDALVARLDAATGSLTWHTFLGGAGTDTGYSIAVDGSGNVYVAGRSTATWGSPVRPYTAGTDAFAARLDAVTGSLTWNTFLGETGNDDGYGIAVDGGGNVYVAGRSTATWGSPVRPYTAGDDAFVARVPQPCINSAATGLWNSGATWVGGVVPLSTEGACILNGHTITLDTSPQIQQLLVEAGGTLVMPLGFSLTAENFVNNDGTMAQTQTVNNATVPFLEIRNLAGTVVQYRGLELITTNNLGDVTAQVQELNSGQYCTTTGSGSPAYARRCYEITPTNNLAATVRLYARTTAELNGISPANLSVYRYSSGWGELLTNRSTGNDGGSYSYAQGDTPGFSDFLAGQTGLAPTAITLQSFSVHPISVYLLTVGGVLLLLLFTWFVVRQQTR